MSNLQKFGRVSAPRNGVPSADDFPIGWYILPPRYVEPFNLMVPGAARGLSDENSGLAQAAAESMRALITVMHKAGDSKFYITNLITNLTPWNTIWGWLVIDEPDTDIPNVSPDEALKARQIVTDLTSPTVRPFAITFGYTAGVDYNTLMNRVEPYKEACDAIMPDYYPVSENVNGEFSSPGLVQFFVALCLWRKVATALGKKFWPVLQGYSVVQDNVAPTFNEERYIIYAAIQAGADGIFFYQTENGDQFGDANIYKAQTVSVILKEAIKNINSFLGGPLSNAVTSEPSNNSLSVATLYNDADFDNGEFYVLLLIHHGPEEPFDAVVTFQKPYVGSIANLIECQDTPLPPLNGNQFTINLRPYQVRLFKFGIGASVYEVDIEVNKIVDHVAGTPQQLALLTTFLKVTVGDTYRGEVYSGNLQAGQKGSVKFPKQLTQANIQIEIWRQTSRKMVKGVVVEENGKYYVSVGNIKSPLPDDFQNLPPDVQADLTTVAIQPDVSPRLVRTISVIFDLLSGKISGDFTGAAGQPLHISSIPGPKSATPDVWLSISSQKLP